MEKDPEWRASETVRNGKRRRVKSDWVESLKKELKCKHCGFADFRALCFHHLDPKEKEAEIANMLRNNYGKEKILEEMAKCEVLCHNCHSIEHYRLRQEIKGDSAVRK
jgi:DNA replication protein DnaC